MSFLVIPIGLCVAGLAIAALPAVPLEAIERSPSPTPRGHLGEIVAVISGILLLTGLYVFV